MNKALKIFLGLAFLFFFCVGISKLFPNSECAAGTEDKTSGEAMPRLRKGPHFFFDQVLFVRLEGVKLEAGRPEKHAGNPIIPAKNPFADLELASGPFTVLPDEKGGGFRMWYIPYSRGPLGVHFGYGTSSDGIAWRLPDLGLTEFQGNKHNNLLLTRVLGGRVLLDRDAANPGERYKAVFYRHDPQPVGFSVSFSPDGLNWSPPLWIEELDDRGEIQGRGASDVVNAFYDPLRREFVAVFKMWSLSGQYEIPVKRGIDAPRCGRRVVGSSRSPDFRVWSEARQILLPDEKDPPTLEFYGLQAVVRRGDLFIGFLPCLIDDAPPDGIGWTELAFSRDGDAWERIRLRVLDRSEGKPSAPDQAIAWVSEVIEVGDRDFIYYNGMEQGHKSGPRSGCLAFLPRNRFIGLEAGAAEGVVLTRPFLLPKEKGRALILNVDASGGEVRVQLRNDRGIIRGFSFADGDPIRSDGTAVPVRWRGRARLPETDQPLQAEFRLRSARLYAFSF